ncbi:MAG: leucine-rich repeat protein, partial [Alphaproteobacteria bacterium]|nr:leucine-rich repeat protein [Alphaproteobacteria bacterium]
GARTIYQMGNIDLNLPESLNKINSYAFYISHISTLNIPSNVTFLAPSAFGSGSQYNESTYLNNLICDEALKSQCEAMLSSWDKNISLTISEQHNGQYYLNGKFYNSVNDMMHGNYIKKRIYTIDEANTVTGPVNRISIKYR